ncbi:MAG: SDR family NAD(P)-dependent oxidoreductase [Patescibacteria group bacterium]
MKSLDGKVVLITGASRGLGKAIALAAARHGARVAINYLENGLEAEKVKKEIQKSGGEAMTFKADVTKAEEVRKMVEAVLNKFGRVDALVNNAGAPIDYKRFTDLGWDDFERHLEVQLHGAYNTIKAVLPFMLKKRSGNIINIASEVTVGRPPSGMSGYISAKYGLVGLSRALASELSPKGIRVNIISPGSVNTDLIKNLPSLYKTMAREPEEVAKDVLSLLSNELSSS